MSVRIAILASDPVSRKAYEQAVLQSGAESISAETVAELDILLGKNETAGLLIDVMSKMRSNSSNDRERLSEITNTFPVANVKWNPLDQEVMAILSIQAEGEDSIQSFVQYLIEHGKPRRMRQAQRHNIHFNVRTALAPHELEEGLQTVTVDISRGGCFLYTLNPYEVGCIFFLSILELEDKTPIRAKARQTSRWGSKMVFPGNGIEFIDLAESQLHELEKYGIA